MTKDEAVKAFREKRPVMMMHRVSCGLRKDIEYDCISAVILRYAKSGHEIIQLELMEKKANSVTITKPEYVYLKGEAEPPFPVEDEMPPVKFRCGEHKNVILDRWELDKLEKFFPDTYKQYINELSEEIAVKCTPYKNHYAEIVKRLKV